ncbi:MAG TPA: NAD(+) diphosphatase [Chthoniobacterales bacterium]|nr:NAD(+) diphosphatase [Chthoniobacterales bacterium]
MNTNTERTEILLQSGLISVNFDRAIERRGQTQWLSEQLSASAQLIPLWRERNLFRWGKEKGPLFVDACAVTAPLNMIFLGIQPNGRSLFAADVRDAAEEEEALKILCLNSDQARFIQLRAYNGFLAPGDRALLFYSRSMIHWHQEQRFCGRCGARTQVEEGGHVMGCTNPKCAAKHFPRTDPATIMLVGDGEKCLLGRQASWPAGVYSTLAGFVESGETLEEAVFREVKEESGVEVKNIRYFGSQPWPFPQSLMLGFFAEATNRELSCGSELEDVRWFTVSEARELLVKLSTRFPHLDTIARRLIKHWVEHLNL